MADEPIADKLSVAQHKAVLALLSEPTIRKAAAVAGVKERTVYNWLRTAAFADEYRVARREAMQQAIARLQQYSGQAAATLVLLMASTKPDAIRLRAALGVLEIAIKGTEIEDLRNELEQLQALIRDRMGDEPSDL